MKYYQFASGLILLWSSNLIAATLIDENFSTFRIPDQPQVSSTGTYATLCDTNCVDPDTDANNDGQPPMTMTLPSMPSGYNWAMVISNQYPLTYKGLGPTQSWAYDVVPSQLRYHAERTPYDLGFAWIHKTELNKNKFLLLETALSIDACIGNGVCTNGPALINSEADYRAMYLQGVSNSNTLELRRYAPRDNRQLYYRDGTKVTLPKGATAQIKISYAGASDQSWRYWLNNQEVYIKQNNQLLMKETSNFLSAILRGNPYVGIYPNVNGSNGNYVEGRIFWLKAAELEKINGISASASRSESRYEAVYAIDNDNYTTWNSGGFAPHWIQLNLNSVVAIKKIRLLVSQFPEGPTTHKIYIGNTSQPTKLVAVVSETTTDNKWIDIDLSAQGELGKYILIKTTSSPSWVSWREIEVYK